MTTGYCYVKLRIQTESHESRLSFSIILTTSLPKIVIRILVTIFKSDTQNFNCLKWCDIVWCQTLVRWFCQFIVYMRKRPQYLHTKDLFMVQMIICHIVPLFIKDKDSSNKTSLWLLFYKCMHYIWRVLQVCVDDCAYVNTEYVMFIS